MMPYVTDTYGNARLLCPDCGDMCVAEYVDIGVGEQRVEPWSCPSCGWEEQVPDVDEYYDDDEDVEF